MAYKSIHPLTIIMHFEATKHSFQAHIFVFLIQGSFSMNC